MRREILKSISVLTGWANCNPCSYGSALTLEVALIFSGTAMVGTVSTDKGTVCVPWIASWHTQLQLPCMLFVM